ncbi:sugar ABC transporter substrate-binding protein [Paenibacillus qinlingensis]|uniref:Multiple sugar transport system substrate-binding protein n=1 Tax=Paenibacillus qinlingensis TaxID=1837343 RepID=A0ABU1P0A1_9BACL|nr:sugar ABC transporter substrate-binding protein [Paenibacillus qinlingensis]MDR6553183.1 multiple sugar transport system substrate-binding protein [Paenibacillus qinlingensis]
MKKTSLVVLSSMLVVTLTACGNGQTESTATTSGAPAAATAAAPPKEVTLKLGLPGSYDVTKKEIIEGFQKKFPYIKLEIQDAPWAEFATKITAQIAGNNAPDIWFQENAIVLGYGKRGVAEDLAPYVKRDLKENDYVSMLNAGKGTDGKMWGIPHGINPVALAYNKKIFKEAGIPEPTENWTYQDMLDTAKKLTKDTNGDGKTDIYGMSVENNMTQGFFLWSKIYGGGWLDETKTKSMLLDPKTVQGITAWQGAMKSGIAPTFDVLEKNGKIAQMFGENKIGMMIMQYSGQLTYKKDYPNLDYDTVMVPKGMDGKRVVPLVANSWVIFSKAKKEQKDAAWEFLKYFLGDDAQGYLAASGASLPLKISANSKLDMNTAPKNKKAFTEGVAQAGMTTDETPFWNEMKTTVQPVFIEMFKGTKTVEVGLKEANDKLNTVINNNK